MDARVTITEDERARRREAVNFARGSVRFEGIVLSDEAEALAERFINGEITLEEHIVSCETATAFLPRLDLEADRRIPTQNGLETHLRGVADGMVRAYAGGVFLGIGEISHGSFRLTMHLYSEIN